MKAKSYKEVRKLQDIPNIGPAMIRDFGLLGISKPIDLIKKNPLKLYQKLCQVSGLRQDPCVLDTYIAAVDFMNGAPAKPWYFYTKIRKKEYPSI
jgi:Pathogenicity locus